MVAQVFADTLQRVAHLYAQLPQPFRLANAGQFQQLRRIDRPGTDHDLAGRAGLPAFPLHGIPHAGAALALQHQPFGQGIGADGEVSPMLYRIQVTMRGAHPAAPGNGRLAHGDAFLRRTVIIRDMRDSNLPRCLDQCIVERPFLVRIGHAQRAVAATEFIVTAALVAFQPLEGRQHVVIAPAPVPHLSPSVVVLRLAARRPAR